MSQIIQTTVDNPLHAIGADILIIEDQQIVLLGLTTLLSTCKGIKRVDKATKAADALEMVKQHAYAILIIDIELPDMSGFDLLEKIRKFRPDVAVIFHSMHEEFWIIKQMMNSGANAIVLKSDDVGELHNAVGYVLAGESYYSSKFQKYCTEYESKRCRNANRKYSAPLHRVKKQPKLPKCFLFRPIPLNSTANTFFISSVPPTWQNL